jgi:hypothetical protein
VIIEPMDIRLREYRLRRFDDKTDLELIHDLCGVHLCDAEADDSLFVLLGVALDQLGRAVLRDHPGRRGAGAVGGEGQEGAWVVTDWTEQAQQMRSDGVELAQDAAQAQQRYGASAARDLAEAAYFLVATANLLDPPRQPMYSTPPWTTSPDAPAGAR